MERLRLTLPGRFAASGEDGTALIFTSRMPKALFAILALFPGASAPAAGSRCSTPFERAADAAHFAVGLAAAGID